jgi:hypothetical protein
MSENKDLTKNKHADELAEIIASAPPTPSYIAAKLQEAGWVHPEDVQMVIDQVTAATQAIVNRAEKAEAEVQRLTGLMLGDVLDPIHNPIRKARHEAEAKVARVKALAERMDDAGHVSQEGYDVANQIRAALAEPERDEEGGRCTELTCPQHGPANRATEEGR